MSRLLQGRMHEDTQHVAVAELGLDPPGLGRGSQYSELGPWGPLGQRRLQTQAGSERLAQRLTVPSGRLPGPGRPRVQREMWLEACVQGMCPWLATSLRAWAHHLKWVTWDQSSWAQHTLSPLGPAPGQTLLTPFPGLNPQGIQCHPVPCTHPALVATCPAPGPPPHHSPHGAHRTAW